MKEALNDKDPKGIRNQKSSYQKISDEINAWPDWKKRRTMKYLQFLLMPKKFQSNNRG